MKYIKLFAIVSAFAVLTLFTGCKKTSTSFSSVESVPTILSQEAALDEPSESEAEITSQTQDVSSEEQTSSQQTQTAETSVSQPVQPTPQPVQPEPQPEPTPIEKMSGTWSCTFLPGTLPEGTQRCTDYVYVFDITINADDSVVVSEKEYIPSDTATYGPEAYFDGKRYILLNDSTEIGGAFKGQFSTTVGKENVAEISIRDYEPFTERIFVNEVNFLTLVDDTHLQWTAGDAGADGSYFPWNTSTVFTKK